MNDDYSLILPPAGPVLLYVGPGPEVSYFQVDLEQVAYALSRRDRALVRALLLLSLEHLDHAEATVLAPT